MHKYEIKDLTLSRTLSKPFIVPTPCPYVIDLADFENPESTRKRLLRKTETLYRILATLRITLIEASRERYSLNSITADALYNRAIAAICDECDDERIVAIKIVIDEIQRLNNTLPINAEETAKQD